MYERYSMRHKHRVSMVDIAKASGVSAATVSRVLSNQDNVSDEVKELVLSSVERLGYVRNLGAATLAASKSNTVGLLVRDMSNQFYGAVASKVQEKTDKAGYDLLMATGGDSEGSQMRAARNLLGHGIGGMIIVSGRISPDVMSYVARFVPIVVLAAGIDIPSVSSVRIDPKCEADLASRVVDMGHKCVAVTASSDPLASTLHSRTSIFLTELIIRGVKTVIMPIEDNDLCSIQKQVDLALSEHVTAIMAGSDTIALSILECLHSKGISCPKDVSVTGFDGVGCLATSLLGLTTVKQPVDLLAKNAVEVMEKYFNDKQTGISRIIVKGDFIHGFTLSDLNK